MAYICMCTISTNTRHPQQCVWAVECCSSAAQFFLISYRLIADHSANTKYQYPHNGYK